MVLDADPGERSGELTLAVALDAARSYADPAAVVADARRWSRYVGIVGADTDAVASFAETHGIDDDFALGDRDLWRAMADLRAAADTPRHVFIGAGPEHRRIADHVEWEYLSAHEAAQKAEWRLEDAGRRIDDGGVLGRVRQAVRDRFDWPF
jgi:hypothetical protein